MYRMLSASLQQLPQYRLENSAVAVVLQLNGCIDAAGGGEFHRITFAIRDLHSHILSRLERIIDENIEAADAGQAKRTAVLALLVDQRQHTHADEVAAMDTLEALGDHRF